MAIQYSTLLSNQFLDLVVAEMGKGITPTLKIYDSASIELVSLEFVTPLQVVKTDNRIEITPPPPAMVMEDGEASIGRLYNGLDEVVAVFTVGSATVNPTAELIISSTSLYAGGMITLSKVELTI